MELEKLTALQLGEKIKQRQVSVLDGVKTVFEQIEKQDSEVHAYLDTYKEEAYKRAEEVQKGIEDGTYTSPLAGVPIAIKDNICINGKKTTCASKILENFVPQYNAEVIDRLEKAGLVIIGKTNMDEFAMGSPTEFRSQKLGCAPIRSGGILPPQQPITLIFRGCYCRKSCKI